MRTTFLKIGAARLFATDRGQRLDESLIEPTNNVYARGRGLYAPRMPAWKRLLDICVTLIAIPFLAPITVMIACAIKLNSNGPVLFRQERVGLGGNLFVLYKFRTMKPGADTVVHEAHTSELIASDKPMTKLDANDKRLIPFGRLLRAAGLDELPQLINVLQGEMSIVGPRPCIPSEYARYSAPQRERFNTPPGLTGLWQVSGKNRCTFSEMVDLDIRYVRRRSLWLDLKIILMTLPAVFIEINSMDSPCGRGDDASSPTSDSEPEARVP